MTEPERGTDVDLLRKAIAKLTTEREQEARNRYQRAATPLLTQAPQRRDLGTAAPGSYGAVPGPGTTAESVKSALLQLEALYNEGLVTIEEYQRKRVEILDRL